MNIQEVLRKFFTKKTLAVCLVAYLIPQLVQLVIRLTWAILFIILLFLAFELCVVFVIKTWFPGMVNVNRVFEWTITTLIRITHSLFNVLCHLAYSCFDLLFGSVFQREQTPICRQRKLSASRNDNSTLVPSSQQEQTIRALKRDGYTNIARAAMTNSAHKPAGRPARFSL